MTKKEVVAKLRRYAAIGEVPARRDVMLLAADMLERSRSKLGAHGTSLMRRTKGSK